MNFKKQILGVISLSFSIFLILTPKALTETKTHHLTINAEGLSYSGLIEKANRLASEIINKTFKDNPNLEQVSILILGERNGQISPILKTFVSRSQWQNNSDLGEWTRYLGRSEVLLGFKTPLSEEPNSRPNSTSPQPTPPTIRYPQPQIQPSQPRSTSPSRRAIEDDPGYRDD